MVLQDSSGFYANHFRGTPFLKPTKNVGFFLDVGGFGRPDVSLFFCAFLVAESLKSSKGSDRRQLSKHQS